MYIVIAMVCLVTYGRKYHQLPSSAFSITISDRSGVSQSIVLKNLRASCANISDPVVVPFKNCKHSTSILLSLYANFHSDEKHTSYLSFF